MPLLLIGLLVGLVLGGIGLLAAAAAKTKVSTDPPQFNGPRAGAGEPIPLLVGTAELPSPICIYSGDVRRGDPYKDGLITWHGDGTVTDATPPTTDDPNAVQFRSTIDLLFFERLVKGGVPLGQVTLRRIWYGDQYLWDGTNFPVPVQTSGSLLSHDPNLEAGPTLKPGGVTDENVRGNGWWYGGGTVDWKAQGVNAIIIGGALDAVGAGPLLGHWEFQDGDGEPYTKGLGLERVYFYSGQTGTEPQNEQIAAELRLSGEVYPSYPKFVRLVFEDFCWGIDASVGGISAEFTVTCPATEIGDYTGLMANGLDVNPVSFLYQAFTCKEFSGSNKLPPVNIASFSAARAAIDAESPQRGLTYRLSATTQLSDIVKQLQEHLDGLLYKDPLTGEICLTLVRAATEEPPTFNETHTLELLEVSKSTWQAAYSQVRVNFEQRNLAGNSQSAQSVAVAKDPGLAESSGSTESLDVSMPTIFDPIAAADAAAKKLSQVNSPLTKMRAKFNRRPAVGGGPSILALRPGDLINWVYPKLGVTGIALRVVDIDFGELDSNGVDVTFLEDRYQAPNYIDPPEGTDTYLDPPPPDAQIGTYAMLTAPYAIARADIPGDARHVLTTAPLYRVPADTDGLEFAANYDRFMMLARRPYDGATEFNWQLFDADSQLVSSRTVPYTLAGVLANDLAVPAANDTGAVAIVISECDPEALDVIGDWPVPPADGRGVLLIGNELFAVTGATWWPEDNEIAVAGFRRMLDSPEPTATIPAGTTVWFLNLSDREWMAARLGPIRQSSVEEYWEFDAEAPTDGLFNDFQTAASEYTATITPLGAGARNLPVTVPATILEDRANRALPPRAVDFASAAVSLSSAATGFTYDFEQLTSVARLFQQREVGNLDEDNSFDLLLVPEQDSDDKWSAESIAGILSDTLEDDYQHVAKLEVWYEYLTGPLAGTIRTDHTATAAGTGTHTFTATAEATARTVRCYLRACFAPYVLGDAGYVPIRRSVARIFEISLTRT